MQIVVEANKSGDEDYAIMKRLPKHEQGPFSTNLLKKTMLENVVVFGVWQEYPDIYVVVLKGYHLIESLKGRSFSWAAIRCRNAEEATAMMQVFGDAAEEPTLRMLN
jgi:hypothetical protein